MSNTLPPDAENTASGKTYWTDNSELLEQYVLGNLSTEEKAQRDAEIADCEPCKQKLQRELEFVAGIRRHGREALKKSLRKKLRKNQVDMTARYNSISLAAAVIIILLGIGIYKLFFNDLITPKHFTNKEITFGQAEQTEGSPRENNKPVERSTENKEEQRSTESSQVQTQNAPPIVATQPAEEISKEENLADAVHEETTSPLEASGETLAAPSSGIWLIGNVITTHQPAATESNAIGLAAGGEREDAVKSKDISDSYKAQQKSIPTHVERKSEQFTLQQVPFADLPQERQTNSAHENKIQTLLEKTDSGFVLKLFDDSLSQQEIQYAVVQAITADSLIIIFPSQTIAYRLPAQWNIIPQNTIRK